MITKPATAMRAEIVESLDFIRSGADDDIGQIYDVISQPVANVRDILLTTGNLPMLLPEMFNLQVDIFGIDVALERNEALNGDRIP